MNHIRAWLYGRDPSVLKNSQVRTEEGDNTCIQEKDNLTLPTLYSSDTIQDSRKLNIFEQAILTVVPLRKGDCLPCKLTGTLCMGFSGVIVLSSAKVGVKKNPLLQVKGRQRTIYLALCGALFLGLETIAVCRMMDWGPFDRSYDD